jgi:hypothetical protein
MQNRSIKKLALASMAFAIWGSSLQSATVQTIVAGYYGGNLLSDGVTVLPDSTVVDLGVFYQSTSFTSGTSIAASLDLIKDDAASLLSFRANNGWVSFGTIALGSSDGSFVMKWDATDSAAGPGFGTNFNLDPTTGALSLKTFVGVKPFLWVQTPSGAGQEFWVGQAISALPAASFDAFYQLDVTDSGMSMFLGTAVGTSGITTIPEPSTAILSGLGFGLLFLRRLKVLKV